LAGKTRKKQRVLKITCSVTESTLLCFVAEEATENPFWAMQDGGLKGFPDIRGHQKVRRPGWGEGKVSIKKKLFP